MMSWTLYDSEVERRKGRGRRQGRMGGWWGQFFIHSVASGSWGGDIPAIRSRWYDPLCLQTPAMRSWRRWWPQDEYPRMFFASYKLAGEQQRMWDNKRNSNLTILWEHWVTLIVYPGYMLVFTSHERILCGAYPEPLMWSGMFSHSTGGPYCRFCWCWW